MAGGRRGGAVHGHSGRPPLGAAGEGPGLHRPARAGPAGLRHQVAHAPHRTGRAARCLSAVITSIRALVLRRRRRSSLPRPASAARAACWPSAERRRARRPHARPLAPALDPDPAPAPGRAKRASRRSERSLRRTRTAGPPLEPSSGLLSPPDPPSSMEMRATRATRTRRPRLRAASCSR